MKKMKKWLPLIFPSRLFLLPQLWFQHHHHLRNFLVVFRFTNWYFFLLLLFENQRPVSRMGLNWVMMLLKQIGFAGDRPSIGVLVRVYWRILLPGIIGDQEEGLNKIWGKTKIIVPEKIWSWSPGRNGKVVGPRRISWVWSLLFHHQVCCNRCWCLTWFLFLEGAFFMVIDFTCSWWQFQKQIMKKGAILMDLGIWFLTWSCGKMLQNQPFGLVLVQCASYLLALQRVLALGMHLTNIISNE